MAERCFEIGVIVARRRLESPWADHTWLPHAVLAAAPAAEPGVPLGTVGRNELFYAGSAELTLHSAQAAHYRDNLASGRPSLWVSLRLLASDGCELSRVTADPYEGEALTDGIGNVVEAISMPPEIAAGMPDEAYVRNVVEIVHGWTEPTLPERAAGSAARSGDFSAQPLRAGE